MCRYAIAQCLGGRGLLSSGPDTGYTPAASADVEQSQGDSLNAPPRSTRARSKASSRTASKRKSPSASSGELADA